MPRLVACPHCHAHVRSDESACPHCGVSLSQAEGRLGRTATAVLMGLTIAGCGPDAEGSTARLVSGALPQDITGLRVTEIK